MFPGECVEQVQGRGDSSVGEDSRSSEMGVAEGADSRMRALEHEMREGLVSSGPSRPGWRRG